MEQQNCDMMSVGVVAETETDNNHVSMEQLLSTPPPPPQTCNDVVVPLQSQPPSPGFFEGLWCMASGFDFITYSPPRFTNDVVSLQYQSPSPELFEGLSPLPEASGFDCKSYSPPGTITPVTSAHNFKTVDSDGLRGSSSSPPGTSTSRLFPNLGGTKSELIFKGCREELMNYFRVFPKLDPVYRPRLGKSPAARFFIPNRLVEIKALPSSAKDRMKQSLQCLTGSTAQHNISQKDASTKCGNFEPECVMELDYSSEFTTSEIFKNRDALEKWASAVGTKNGFDVVVKRSDSGAGNKKPRITLACERSGYYRDIRKNTELHQNKKLKMIGTKKCGCPFELKGQKLDTNGDWTLHVICGKHNHHIVSHTTTEKGTASTQDATWIVTVMATYGENTAKFQIPSTFGIDELKEKVAKWLELELGSFNIKYEDGGNLISIACDEALKEYVECSTSSLNNRLISLVVTDKVSNPGSSCKKSKSGKGKSPAI